MIRVGYLAQAGRSAFDPVREEPGRPARLEELVECPVALLSTSPDRDDTILVKDPFVD